MTSPENISGLVESLVNLNEVVMKVETDVRTRIGDICKLVASIYGVIYPSLSNSVLLKKVRYLS